MSYFIEWNRQENGNIISNSLSLYYQSGYAPSSYSNNQYGFVQQQKYVLCANCVDNSYVPSSTFPPNIFSNTFAYAPAYIANFEQGIFYYPIITNNFQFGGQYYNYPLLLYKYYVSVSVCQKMYYYITKPYIVVDDDGNSYQVNLFYRHVVNPSTAPIHYIWSLEKILYSDKCTSLMQNRSLKLDV